MRDRNSFLIPIYDPTIPMCVLQTKKISLKKSNILLTKSTTTHRTSQLKRKMINDHGEFRILIFHYFICRSEAEPRRHPGKSTTLKHFWNIFWLHLYLYSLLHTLDSVHTVLIDKQINFFFVLTILTTIKIDVRSPTARQSLFSGFLVMSFTNRNSFQFMALLVFCVHFLVRSWHFSQ